MKKIALILIAGCLPCIASSALACEYVTGETKFVDYANCRYGPDSIEVVNLPDGANWDQCVYFVEPFRPAKLLAVTKDDGGKELLSVNDRSNIGNPCYLVKRNCDAALTAALD